MSKCLFLAIFLSMPLTQVLSQTRGVADTDSMAMVAPYVAEEVVVTATRSDQAVSRLPYAVDVLNGTDIKKGNTGATLEEVLRSVPGLIVNDRNNLSQGDRISVRGIGSRASFGVRGIKILLDDIPLTMPDGQSQLNNLDINAIGQIEVLRGPSSSLYGNASGGVINISSRFPTEHMPITTGITYAQFGTRKFEASAGLTTSEHGVMVRFTDFVSDGFREHAYARITQLTALHQSRLNSRWEIKSVIHFVDAPYLFNPSSLNKATAETAPASVRTFVQAQGSAKQVQQTQGGVTLIYRKGRREFKTTTYGVVRELLNPIPGSIVELKRKAGGLRNVFTYNGRPSSWFSRWTAGIDLEVQDDARTEYDNDGIPDASIGTLKDASVFDVLGYGSLSLKQDEEVYSAGVFSEVETRPFENAAVTLGVRFDNFSFNVDDHLLSNTDASGKRDMQHISPMLALTYQPGQNATIYANATTGFQTPTTNELSNQPGQAGGFNTRLEPEKMQNLEIGIRGAWPAGNLLGNASFYRMSISDMLIPFQIDDTEGDEIYYRNAGRTLNKGAELSLQWLPPGVLSYRLSYSFTNFVFENYSMPFGAGLQQLAGKRVPGVPSHHLYTDVLFAHPSGFHGLIEFQLWSDSFANDFNGPPPLVDGADVGVQPPKSDFINEGYLRTDIRFGWKHSFSIYKGEITLGMNNIFDAAYSGSITPNANGNRFFEPAPGRNWFLAMSMTAKL